MGIIIAFSSSLSIVNFKFFLIFKIFFYMLTSLCKIFIINHIKLIGFICLISACNPPADAVLWGIGLFYV